MENIRNSQGKLICRIDKPHRTIEIAVKGCVTTICFMLDGTVKIKNTKAA